MEYVKANAILIAIAETNEVLASLYAYFRTGAEKWEVHRGIDFRKCDNNLLYELFIEVEVNDCLAYCWWLDVRFYPDSWHIDGVLLKTEDGTQSKIASIAEYSGNEVEALIEKLQATSRAISDSARNFNSTNI